MNQLGSLLKSFPAFVKSIFSSDIGCQYFNGVFVCNKQNLQFSFDKNLVSTFLYDEQEISQTIYITCLPIKLQNATYVTFSANKKLFLQNGSQFVSLDKTFRFDKVCLSSTSICQDLYETKQDFIFGDCSVGAVSHSIYIACETRQKISFFSGGHALVSEQPLRLEYENFPITFNKQSIHLDDILHQFHSDTLRTNFQKIEINDLTHTLSNFRQINSTNDDRVLDTSQDDFFDDLLNTEEFNSSHVFGLTSLCLTIIIFLIINCYCLTKVKCYRLMCLKLCCLCCSRRSQNSVNSAIDSMHTGTRQHEETEMTSMTTQVQPPPPPSAPNRESRIIKKKQTHYSVQT